MRGISGQDQDTLTHLGQLNGQTATVEGRVEMGDLVRGVLRAGGWYSIIYLQVVLPTPPLPPTNTHFRDVWSMMFCSVGSISSIVGRVIRILKGKCNQECNCEVMSFRISCFICQVN